MFDLGRSLRAAREARGLELGEIEAQTKIRARHLAALEEELFDELPRGYERTFLRSYAEFLELDPQHYLDEYASRFPPEEPPLPAPPRRPRRVPALGLLAGVAVVGVVVAVVAAAHFGAADRAQPPLPRPTHVRHRPHPRPPIAVRPARRRPHPKPRPKAARVVISAVAGDCWISVRAGSAEGRVLFERTLEQGQAAVAVARPRLWVRLGAPRNVEVTIAGHRLAPLSTSSPLNLYAGARGARLAAPGYVPSSR